MKTKKQYPYPASAPLLHHIINQEPLLLNLSTNKSIKSKRLDIMTKSSVTHFLNVSKAWDQGNKKTRVIILEDFIRTHQGVTASQLELELVFGASLFLTRITAWLRLSYLLDESNLSVQLDAISVFLSASSGTGFLVEFIEVGGLVTVLEILSMNTPNNVKLSVLQLLYYFVNAGRKYKEYFCKSRGIENLVECLITTKNDKVVHLIQNIMFELTQGNTKFIQQLFNSSLLIFSSTAIAPAVYHCTAQILKALIPQISTINNGVIDACILALKSPNQDLQFESYELIKDLCKRPELHDSILKFLLAVIKCAIDEEQDDRKRKEVVSLESLYSQQAFAAKLLGYMAARYNYLAIMMVNQNIVNGLLNVVGNANHSGSQKAASETLLLLSDKFESVSNQLLEFMGKVMFTEFTDHPSTFYEKLNAVQIRALRQHNTESGQFMQPETEAMKEARIMSATKEATEQKSGFEGFEFEDKSKVVVQSKVEEVLEMGVKRSAIDKIEQAKAKEIEKVYVPFAMVANAKTFTKCKFKVPNMLSKDEMFSKELDEYKDSNPPIQDREMHFKDDLLEKMKMMSIVPEKSKKATVEDSSQL